MRPIGLLDLPTELIVKILQELDEQSLGRTRCVSRHLNTVIEKFRGVLAKQTIYMAVLKENELLVERYLRRSRWEDYKYEIAGKNSNTSVLRQLQCANIDTLRFEMTISDKMVDRLAERIAALKSSVYRVFFSKCRLSAKSLVTLLSSLTPQQVTIEFDLSYEEIGVHALCEYAPFREIKNLNLINSRLNDNELRLITAEHLTVYEKTELTLAGLRQTLLDWYNGKRIIQEYHLSVSERIVPERLFHGIPFRRRSIIAWEIRNSDGVLHVSVLGPGVSIVKVFDIVKSY